MPHQIITTLDISGAILGLIATAAMVRATIWAWPLGIIGLFVDILLYWSRGIYADTVLNFVYVGMMLYGWHHWLYGGKNHSQLPIKSIKRINIIWLIPIIISAIFCVALFLKTYTDSNVPYLDAITATLSLLAQWLACRKIIENWAVWFVADTIYIGIYFYKGIPAHAILNVIYLGMAVVGYYSWRHKIIKN